MPIPEILKSLLGKLTDEDAETVWVWLDETEDAIEVLIEHGIAATHPAVEEKICRSIAEADGHKIIVSTELEEGEIPEGFKPQGKPQ